MRLDRLPPLSTPVRQPGHKDDRPPRRQPELPETAGRHEAPADHPDGDLGQQNDPGDRPTPPDHLDIIV
jgi:hypothetical protein